MKKKLLNAAGLLFVGLTLQAQVSGAPDLSFGLNGEVRTNVGGATYIVKAQALQPDGKLVFVGEVRTGIKVTGFVARRNADGSIDSGFTENPDLYQVEFTSVRIQADGKILVGGRYETILRLHANGTVDTSFGNNGLLQSGDYAVVVADMLVQPDQKILVLTNYSDTETGDADYKLARYTTTGAPDTTFSGDGKVITDMGYTDTPKSLALHTDGKIVVGGHSYGAASPALGRIFATKYLSNGNYDTSFGNGGKFMTGYNGSTYVDAMGAVIQADGKVICAGKSVMGTNGVIQYAIRVNTDGQIDTTYGSNAGVNFYIPGGITSSNQRSIARLDANGKLVISDMVDPDLNWNNDIIFRRFNTNGTPDNSFGTMGIVTIQYFNRNDYVAGFDFKGDKIVLSGNTEETYYQNRIAFAQLNSDGTFDTTYSTDGKSFFAVQAFSDDLVGCSLKLPDGKMLVGGSSYLNDGMLFTLAKYNTDGTLDTSFGSGTGKLALPFYGTVYALAVDDNGRILVGGDNFEMSMARLMPDGSLDISFGTNGMADLANISFGGKLRSIAVLPNGKILAAGSMVNFGNSPADEDLMIIRFNSNGTIDGTFGNGGIASGNSSSYNESVYKIKVLGDGKIVAAAAGYTGNSDDILILKYNANGTVDNTFNGTGKQIIGGSGWDQPTDMEIQPDGKILVAAYLENEEVHFTVVRLMTNGSFDATFGVNGMAMMDDNGQTVATGIELMENNKIVLGGHSLLDNNYVRAFARLHPNGTADSSFGDQGIVYMPIDFESDGYAAGLTLEGNRAIIAGTTFDMSAQAGDYGLSAIYLDSFMSIGEQPAQTSGFYPNPATNSITFDSNIISVSISDITGKRLPVSFSGGRMDISALPAGVYLVTSSNEDGNTQTDKLIKK